MTLEVCPRTCSELVHRNNIPSWPQGHAWVHVQLVEKKTIINILEVAAPEKTVRFIGWVK